MQITPRRRAVIIGYRKLNMSFSAIAAAVNLSKSTASCVYYRTVNNTQVRKPSVLLTEITNKLEQL